MKNAFTEFTPQRDLFYEYLLHLGLFRIKIWEDSHSLYAILSDTYGNVPVNAFSQVPIPKQGDMVTVRLSKADLFNDSITGGFFDSLREDTSDQDRMDDYMLNEYQNHGTE